MKHPRAVSALVAILITYGAAPAGACNPGRTLLEMIQSTERIALVRVENIDDADASRQAIVLKVAEIWKGPAESEIRITQSGQLYAFGHRVSKGDQILIFLEGENSQTAGVLVVEDEYKHRVRELVREALTLPDRASRRAWSVEAATIRPTRPAEVSSLRSALGESALTEGESRTIADAFIHDPSADASIPELIALLSGYHDRDFDRAIVTSLEAAVSAPSVPSWVPRAIRNLAVSLGWRDWGTTIWERERSAGTLKTMWPAIARDLGLPSADPTGVPVSE